MFLNVNNIKYLGLYNTIDNDKFISKSKLNEIDELFVCQKNNIISNTRAVNICCNYYNIETDLCESDNFISIYFAKDVIYYYGFENNMRNNISFIIHENLTYPGEKKLNVKANSKVEIHFNNPVHNLESFFDSSYESKVKYIISIDFSHFDASLVTNFKKMFHKCNKLEFIDFSNFNTKRIENMENMFYECSSLNSLDLSSFDTSNALTMDYMFNGCSSLKLLDLSNLNTSSVTLMLSMFSGCSSLISLNLSCFYTSRVTRMEYMFSGCSSLNSLDLSDFNTSKVGNMFSMFENCSSLYSLDLSHFDTSYVNNIYSMFSGCSSLKFLDLSNFNLTKPSSMNNFFTGCLELKYINLKYAEINASKITSPLWDDTPNDLVILSENEVWQNLFYMSEKNYINCVNNISSSNNKDKKHFQKFFKNNLELDNLCQACGSDNFIKS